MNLQTQDVLIITHKGYKTKTEKRSGVIIITPEELLHIIDVVWNECTESNEVPSTQWAFKIIEKAVLTFKQNT